MQYFSITTTTIKSFILTAIVVALAGAALALPQAASAYSTTAQSVTKLTDNTLLFQVTYRLNFMNRDFRTPVLASRVATSDPTVPQVQYSLRDTTGNLVTTGVSTAIVISEETTIEDGQYYLPERTPGLFTLIAIVQLPDDVVAAGGEAALHIDWLPFTLIKDGESQLARIPDYDLATFKTPAISW